MQMLALEGIKTDLEAECLWLSTSSHHLEAQLEAKTVELDQAVTAAQGERSSKVRSPPLVTAALLSAAGFVSAL